MNIIRIKSVSEKVVADQQSKMAGGDHPETEGMIRY